MTRPCPFCALAAGTDPAEVVYEDEACLGFLDKSPLAIGHCLLIPRTHVATLFEADDATVSALALASRTLGAAIVTAFQADGLFVAQNNVVSQSVPHLHLHLVPRWRGDKLFSGGSMVWKRVRYRDDAHRAETAERIRKALR
jgi:histidine triad (HIT) family protein